MTTKRSPPRAIHGPGQEKTAGSAIRANPTPSPPNHRETVHPDAGSSPARGRGSGIVDTISLTSTRKAPCGHDHEGFSVQ